MKIFRAIFLILLTAVWVPAAWAEVSIETSVSRSQVPVGEQLTLDVIIENAEGRISPPTISSLDGFTSYSQAHSQEISIINGRSSSRSIFSYILVANSIGKKTIGPFAVQIGGKEYKVAPVEVEVLQPGYSAGPFGSSYAQGPASAPPARALPSGDVSDQDIFVKAWLDKDEVYVNEPVILTYTLYTRLSATYKGFEKEPVTTGFWVEEFPPDKAMRKTEQLIHGVRYVVADVKKLALFPTQAGVFTIDPGVLSATVEVQSEDPFDNFFSYNVFGARRTRFPSMLSQVVPKVISAPPVTVTAKALPESGRPKNFSGAVGRYQIESTLDKNEVEAGNPVTYRVRISGRGNLNTVQPPSLPKLEGFKVYDSSSSVNISKDRLIVEGKKVTETVIVPKKAGAYTIPALEFSYFDPESRSYQELKTSEQTLTVKPGTEPESLPADTTTGAGVEPVAKESVSVMAEDIRYIKSSPGGRDVPDKELHRRPFYWVLNALFFGAWALFTALSARKTATGPGLRASRRSHAFARQKLKAASRFLHEDKQQEFYAEISKVVHAYFGSRLGIPEQQVSLERLEARAGDELPAELFNQIKALFDELSMGRFARMAKSKDEMKSVYQMADRAITGFEKVKLK